ncbi:hypothetical protein EC957_007491 [Mortierella hygrophila]|uniref:site-specific DNA-methyltransferase (adenine-specific) n=1 Tax=Mortierella hygrophila TaxID=979708 RepID=A0A9P6FDD7_9FUNG|nr:hypothetical protein EC957_007491 [Mortierella hygrophila]
MDTETDVESDTDLLLESDLAGGRTTTLNPDIRLCSLSTTPVTSGTITPAPTTTTPLSTGGPAGASSGPVDDLDGSATAADLYRSTIEFLALMTAFVSVVCWLMQTRLLDGGPSNRGPSTVTAAMEGIDMEQDGPEPGHRDGCAQLREFLRLFDDLDNVLNPIKEALSQTHDSQQRWQQQHIDEQESDARLDPMDSVGLFAWHYFLFSSDRESPFEREAHAIDIPNLHLIHFDVLLNELYTTHILSMTAKEHQKDHGQFYTPPGVVDFMWKRTIIGRGRLLDQFVESMPSALSAPPSFCQQESLIPTALDPCLGVSTFLSCYVRLLIQEAERDHAETIWRSEAASRLLLTQICENVWGIELDGFAFWMARCGILVALMPLVQHVESFSHHPHYHHHYHHHHQHPQQRHQPYQQHQQSHRYQQQQQAQLPRLHLFRSDTLQLTVPDGTSPKSAWDRHCILQLRTPSRLQFDFIVTNPPYMIRKTGTFSAPDPEVYDWSILGASIATVTSAAASAAPPGLSEGSSPALKTKSKSSTKASKNGLEEDERLTPSTVDTGDDDSGSEATMTHGGSDRLSKGATEAVLQSPRTKKLATQVRPTGSKGMMQAYGYFVWFAAQRIKPGKGVVCMITASQWLTLEFAVKLRAWLFENCLMDEFFQFEPYKVFSKVQTDSLIFKIRAIPPDLLPSTSSPMSSSPLPLGDHRTVFLRHTDHHKPLVGILQDYMAFSSAEEPQVARPSSSSFVVGSATPTTTTNSNNDLNIMVSSKTREELAAVIMAPSATPTATAATATGKGDEATAPATYTYSFAPMMPASVLTTYMLALTQDLGAICSAGTKKMNRLRAVEPLLWHRGPNTNPVYGLVVRMEYARAMFGEGMTSRWFRPALYWNGKNSPEGPPTTAAGAAGGGASGASALAVPSKVLHREGQFWQGRDRQRLSKKEGSPAESYCVPTSDPQRMYALCMVDKESVKVLRQQVEQKVEGSQALWNYLTDVRSHFQPGLASKRKVVSGGKAQAVDDEGVAFCSTNQCGADVPEKIVHPINYGYFSKTQPRQRFFLDTDSLAVTNQCIYLTLNKLSSHYDAEQCPPLMYFLTLLNSTTLQFFVLHHCQYDQQGRMRLFRESMAKIPFQDRDVKNCPERIRYVAELGASMVELKDMLYSVVTGWRLTGSHHSSSSGGGVSQHGGAVGGERRGSTGGLASIAFYPSVAAGASSTAPTSTGGSSNQGLMDWVRKGGNPPPGLLSRVKDQVRRMLVAQQASRPRHLYQDHGPAASYTPGLGGTHVTKARPSSSAPSSSSSSSILHLNKPRGFNAGTMMGSGGGGAAFFTDTDTDTNTFTDTDTDTDDTMDPWMTSRLEGHVSARMVSRSGMYATDYHNQSQSQSQSGRGQGQHSLARILNMPGDDREMSMDEKRTTTSSMPVPIPEGGSRDRRLSFRATVSDGFGRDEEFDEAESKKAAVSVPVSTAMETDLDELYRHNKHHQHQIGGVAPSSSFNDHQISHDSDRILQALERAITMVEMVQWAVDQYGYMLYGIRPKFQKLLELELKIIYGSRLESLIAPSTPPSSASAPGVGEDGRAVAASLGITAWGLYRWEGDGEPMPSLLNPVPGSGPASATSSASSLPSESAPGNSGRRQLLPTYALQVLENAQSATQLLREIFDQFPALPSLSSSAPLGPSKK